MRDHITLRLYGEKASHRLYDLLDASDVAWGWELVPTAGLDHYPILELKPWVWEKIKPVLDKLKIEYDDVSPSDEDDNPREVPRPKRLIITYKEKEGKLHYCYEESVPQFTAHHHASYQGYKVTGVVPEQVVVQGKESITAYATTQVQQDLNRQIKRNRLREARDKNPNFPITFDYKGVTLQGRIVSTEDTALRARLEQPYQGENFVIYGYASAILGQRIYDGKGSFTDDAIKTAKRLLREIYTEAKHAQENKEVLALVEDLSGEEE